MGKLVSALGISHLETSELPELLGNSSDGSENCPATPPASNTIDKAKLDARAIEQARAEIEEAQRKAAENTATEKARLDAEDKSFLNTPGEIAAAKAQTEQSTKNALKVLDESKAEKLKIQLEAARVAEENLKAKEEAEKAVTDKEAAIRNQQAAEVETEHLKIKLAETEAARNKAQEAANETWYHRVWRWITGLFSSLFSSAPSAAVAPAIIEPATPQAHSAVVPAVTQTAPNAANTVNAIDKKPVAEANTNAVTLGALSQQRLSATKEVLAHADTRGVSLQLFDTADVQPARMENFLSRAQKLGILSEIYLIPAKINGKDGLRVFYGIFANSEAARDGIKSLPQRYKDTFALTLNSLGGYKYQ
jgi:hypothetical protein